MSNSATPSILIQCLIHRAAGTEIELYGKHYHFTSDDPANPKVPQVCAIPLEDARQIHRLLSISAYRKVDADAELPPLPKVVPSQTIAADQEDDDTPAPAGEPVIIQGPEGQDVNLSAMERPELAQFAQEHFKIKVHHKWKPANIIAKILEAMRAPSDDE